MLFYRRLPNMFLLQKAYKIKRKLHNNFTPKKNLKDYNTTSYECINFFISFTNCIIVTSILWGFESYKEKVKLIEETNVKIGELVIAYRLLERKCTKSEYNLSD